MSLVICVSDCALIMPVLFQQLQSDGTGLGHRHEMPICRYLIFSHNFPNLARGSSKRVIKPDHLRVVKDWHYFYTDKVFAKSIHANSKIKTIQISVS